MRTGLPWLLALRCACRGCGPPEGRPRAKPRLATPRTQPRKRRLPASRGTQHLQAQLPVSWLCQMPSGDAAQRRHLRAWP